MKVINYDSSDDSDDDGDDDDERRERIQGRDKGLASPPASIGVARGCTGCTCIFQSGEKKLGAKFTGKSKCTPGRECSTEAEQESILLGNWGDLDSGRGYLGSFSVCFEGDN